MNLLTNQSDSACARVRAKWLAGTVAAVSLFTAAGCGGSDNNDDNIGTGTNGATTTQTNSLNNAGTPAFTNQGTGTQGAFTGQSGSQSFTGQSFNGAGTPANSGALGNNTNTDVTTGTNTTSGQ